MTEKRFAGIDVAKAWLDVAIGRKVERVDNAAAAIRQLADRLRQAGITAVGLEPTGIYGRLAVAILREAGFEVLQGEERLERAVEQGAALARRLGRLPKMADWAEARRADDSLLTEWQIYRMIDVQPAWAAFQFLVRERLRDEGVAVAPDGSVGR